MLFFFFCCLCFAGEESQMERNILAELCFATSCVWRRVGVPRVLQFVRGLGNLLLCVCGFLIAVAERKNELERKKERWQTISSVGRGDSQLTVNVRDSEGVSFDLAWHKNGLAHGLFFSPPRVLIGSYLWSEGIMCSSQLWSPKSKTRALFQFLANCLPRSCFQESQALNEDHDECSDAKPHNRNQCSLIPNK